MFNAEITGDFMFKKIRNLLTGTLSGKKGRIKLCLTLFALSLVGIIVGLTLSEKYTINDGADSYTVSASTDDVHTLIALAGIDEDEIDGCTVSEKNVININRVVTGNAAASFFGCDDIFRTVSSVVKDVTVSVPDVKELAESKKEKVEYKYETVTETIKFKYKTVKSDELEIGQTKVTYGKNGSKKVTYKIKYVDGKKVSKEVYKEEIIKKAVDQVETVGTRRRASQAVMTSDDVDCISTLIPSSPIELDANGRPVNYSKIIEGKGCAYACGNMTATGVKPQPGYVAVNPKQIPYGTKMYIVSADGKYIYGYAVAADTGGFAKKGERIVDLRFNTESECNKFGVRNVIIYILD